jgi:hypothetical protein
MLAACLLRVEPLILAFIFLLSWRAGFTTIFSLSTFNINFTQFCWGFRYYSRILGPLCIAVQDRVRLGVFKTVMDRSLCKIIVEAFKVYLNLFFFFFGVSSGLSFTGDSSLKIVIKLQLSAVKIITRHFIFYQYIII